jgi:ActR/RegA family two-component response regulator
MLSDKKNDVAALAVIDLRLQHTPLVLIEKLKLIERLIRLDPDARLMVLTANTGTASAIEDAGGRTRRYLTNTGQVKKLRLADKACAVDEAAVEPSGTGSIDEIELAHIRRVLALNQGNKSATARALRIDRTTLRRKLARASTTR